MFGTKSRKTKVVKQEIDPRTPAIIKIQSTVRAVIAKIRIRKQAKRVWQRVYDPLYKKYFWYNNLNKKSRWDDPKFVLLFHPEDHEAAINIEKIIRGFISRMRVRKLSNTKYTRFYDAGVNKFYWLDKSTGKTTWNVSKWLFRQEIEMPIEDKMLYESNLKIKELEALLKQKDIEIKEVRKKRFEELEPEIIKDKIADVKHLQRSKNMDEWSIEELSAWFTEMKMELYVPFLFKNRVDGLLFINLTDDEWDDMGIKNLFHQRKLKLILRSYRTRYQWKKDKVVVDEDEDLLSEYAPSELSDLLNKEDEADDYHSSEEEEDDDESYDSEDEILIEQTAEQRLQRKLDAKNVEIKLKVKGDGLNFPIIGDIVRVRYVTMLTESGKVVMSTKHVLGRPWVEFVLGIDQVIKGFDRALPLMSIGERSHLIISPEYAYGIDGLPPHIPSNVSLTFDLTLLGLRPRSLWVRPLIQDNNTNEKPYHADLNVYMVMVNSGDLRKFEEDDEDKIASPLKGMVSSGGGTAGNTKKSSSSANKRNSINLK